MLRRLVAEPGRARPGRPRRRCEICHFDPDTGADLGRRARRRRTLRARPATTACSPTATSSTTQLIDRHTRPRPAAAARRAAVTAPAAPAAATAQSSSDRSTQLPTRSWSELRRLARATHGYRLPDDAQAPSTPRGARPDFVYRPARRHRRRLRRRPAPRRPGPAGRDDASADERLDDLGWTRRPRRATTPTGPPIVGQLPERVRPRTRSTRDHD